MDFFIFLFYFFYLLFFSNFNWSPILFGVGLRWLGLKSTELILKILVYRSELEWSCTRWSTTDSDQVHWGGMAVSMYSCVCFCGALLYFRISAQKSVFCYMIPNFVNSPFVALGKTVHFAPWDRFFDFLFPSYSRFPKRNRPTRQKVFPHRLPVTTQALSSAFGPARFALWLDQIEINE